MRWFRMLSRNNEANKVNIYLIIHSDYLFLHLCTWISHIVCCMHAATLTSKFGIVVKIIFVYYCSFHVVHDTSLELWLKIQPYKQLTG